MRARGQDVAFYGPTGLVALSTTCELSVDGDVTEFTSALSGNAKRNRPGRYGWSVTCDMLVDITDASGPSFLSSIRNKKTLSVVMRVQAPGDTSYKRYYGSVCVRSLQLTGSLGSMATYKVTMVGDGALLID